MSKEGRGDRRGLAVAAEFFLLGAGLGNPAPYAATLGAEAKDAVFSGNRADSVEGVQRAGIRPVILHDPARFVAVA